MTNRDEQICTLHREGWSQRQIAKTLGLSHVAVGKRLRALAAVTTNGPPDSNHQDVAHQQETIVQALEKIRGLGESLTHAWSPAALPTIRVQGATIANLAEHVLQTIVSRS